MANPIFQTSYSQRPGEALLGQIAEAMAPSMRSAGVARGQVKAGFGVFKVPGTGTRGQFPTKEREVFHQPNPSAAVDVDAFLTATATAATPVTHTSFNGVVGSSELQPARKLTITLSNHADFDATTATVVYLNEGGRRTTEVLNIPDGGNATLTTTGYVSQLISVALQAQAGVGGSYTIGIAAMPALTIADFLGVAIRQVIHETFASNDVWRYTGGGVAASATADYVDCDSVPFLSQGGIWVASEEAVSDMDPVYVRVAAGAGGSILGAFRNDADTASCVAVTGARFVRNASAPSAGQVTPAWVRFGYGW